MLSLASFNTSPFAPVISSIIIDSVTLIESDKLFAKDITSTSDSEVLSDAIELKPKLKLSAKDTESALLVANA